MLKRRKRERMNVRPETRVRSKQHLQFVRGFSCLIEGKHECHGRIEAHHLKDGSDHGIGVKASDNFAVALCSRAHELGHRKGWKWFEAEFQVDLMKAATSIAAQSPALRRLAHDR